MKSNLESMEKFFKYDFEIKNILYNTMPKEIDKYNKESLMKYSDKLFKSLNDIEYYINIILNSFNFLDKDKQYLNHFMKALKSELINCKYDFNKLKHFYEVFFANMREELVNNVGNNCFGCGGKGVFLNEAKSLNELLHIIHQTIINNENNYRILPIIFQRKNHNNGNITLYGKESFLANSIYSIFPDDLYSSFVEIMSLSNDRVILMIRDIGHSLSVEIEKDNDKYYVKYFIPKICNVNMVNDLKGVRKVNKDSRFTTGIFTSNLEQLPFEIIEFIKKVPTDEDMFIEGGLCYKEENDIIK